MASLNELLHRLVDLHNPDRAHPNVSAIHGDIDATVPAEVTEEKGEEDSPND